LSRGGCIAWLTRHGYPIPERSACTFCPYRSDHEWRRLQALDPVGFNGAVQLDADLRKVKGQLGLIADPYLHRSMTPLSEIDFAGATARQPDLFGEDCSGVCGA